MIGFLSAAIDTSHGAVEVGYILLLDYIEELIHTSNAEWVPLLTVEKEIELLYIFLHTCI